MEVLFNLIMFIFWGTEIFQYYKDIFLKIIWSSLSLDLYCPCGK